MQYDKKLTEALTAFLAREDEGTPAWGHAAADFILRLTGDRFLAARTERQPALLARKARAVISSRLQVRLDGVTRQEVRTMEEGTRKRAQESVEATPAAHWDGTGRRKDHDKLPRKVQALYERGGELYRKMKAEFETLKTMENAAPCDRYEHLKILASLDDEYRRGWELYDHYEAEYTEMADEAPEATAKEVAAARKWISVNLARIEGETDPERRAKLAAKLRTKMETVRRGGGVFGESIESRAQALE